MGLSEFSDFCGPGNHRKFGIAPEYHATRKVFATLPCLTVAAALVRFAVHFQFVFVSFLAHYFATFSSFAACTVYIY